MKNTFIFRPYKKRLMRSLNLILLILFSLAVFAQDNENGSRAYSPTVGVGVGALSIFGDINDNDYNSPFGGNPGFNVYILQPISNVFDFRVNFLAGNIKEEERSLDRNVNFKSEIRALSANIEYNFSNFLPEKRKITPFLSVGAEAVEFNPKSDLEAFGGEPYNYWSDGTIRNMAENSTNANNAIVLQRDFDYETDIRESGLNGSTTYAERALSIPMSIGVNMHLNDQFDFRLESTLRYTFTDNIDGLSRRTDPSITGNRRANGRNDILFFSGFSLSYNFQKVEGADIDQYYKKGKSEPFDFLATGNTEDYDGDNVIDLIDICPNTPQDVEVDSVGCPIDSDGDGVPDYLDEEVNTEYPEFANDKGVEMTDDMIYESYLRYQDSTLEFAEVIEREFTGQRKDKRRRRYRVRVGEYNKGVTPKDMTKLLSLSDLSKIDQGNTTLYAVGNYSNLKDAKDRAVDLTTDGYENVDVIKRNNSGEYEPLNINTESEVANQNATPTPTSTPTNTNESTQSSNDEVVFRVQLGAFRQRPEENSKFAKIPSLFVVESGGYYRYMSGSFNSFEDAANHKVKMVVEGFKGAFVVAYKNGTRVSLRSVGVNPISSDPILGR